MPKRNWNNEVRKTYDEFLTKMANGEKEEFLKFAVEWGKVEKSLEADLLKLAKMQVKDRKQLYKNKYFQKFLFDVRQQTYKYNLLVAADIADQQRKYIQGSLGILTDVLRVNLVRLNPKAVEFMIGQTFNGTPLFKLLQKSYPKDVDNLVRILINSTAKGINPLETARLLKESMNGNIQRAITIARTEQLRVFRDSNLLAMKESGVVKGWEWDAEDDACPECDEKDGKIYTLDEPFDTHPNCRCAPLPVV